MEIYSTAISNIFSGVLTILSMGLERKVKISVSRKEMTIESNVDIAYTFLIPS